MSFPHHELYLFCAFVVCSRIWPVVNNWRPSFKLNQSRRPVSWSPPLCVLRQLQPQVLENVSVAAHVTDYSRATRFTIRQSRLIVQEIADKTSGRRSGWRIAEQESMFEVELRATEVSL